MNNRALAERIKTLRLATRRGDYAEAHGILLSLRESMPAILYLRIRHWYDGRVLAAIDAYVAKMRKLHTGNVLPDDCTSVNKLS